PVDTKGLDVLLDESRESTHLKMIPRGDTKSGKLMLQCFRNNEALVLAIDQDTKAQSHFVDFFGRMAKTPKVAGRFALKFSAPIILAFGFRNPDGSHQFNLELISTPPYENIDEIKLTQLCSEGMERAIKDNPGQWAWFHRRWKSRPEEEERVDE
ncbi:MAG: lysophospholipid acyltransferase family protein, partial [Proteobacteria bacterium]|nr:lysophospholipid acyltransferase family protein [Pseudomonadota bacterium]